MSQNEIRETRIAWGMLILCPLSMIAIYLAVSAGFFPGVEAGHPVEYLQSTCLMWAGLMVLPPLLRLLRIVALPMWLLFLSCVVMYLYVLSLCMGFYFNVSWWGYFTHIIVSTIVAGFVFLALCVIETKTPKYMTFGSKKGMIVILFIIAMSFGAIWEMLEAIVDLIARENLMVYEIVDTLGDLIADVVGVSVMSVTAWFVLGRYSTADVASQVRIRRKGKF